MVYPVHTDGKWILISLLFHFFLFAVISLAIPQVAPAPCARAGEESITLRVDFSGKKGQKTAAKDNLLKSTVSEKTAVPVKAEIADAVTDIPESAISKVVSKDAPVTAGAGTSSPGSEGGDSNFIKAKILIPLNPSYPRFAVRRGLEGEVLLDADIDTAGTPLNVDVFKSSGHTVLDKAAVDSVIAARFIPALYRGKEIPDRLRIAVNFSLKDYR